MTNLRRRRGISTLFGGDLGALVGFGVVAVAALLYWLANREFDAGRGDFFYLADAFLHGRTWLDVQLGPNDVIPVDGRFYVPFAPFPAIALMPLVAILGPMTADQVESGINAVLAAACVGMCWWMLGRIGVSRIVERLWLIMLFGFSTQILWVTARGGVWHTGQLIATILTFACLIEVYGKQRSWLIGLVGGAAFLTRAPLAFALPFYLLMLLSRDESISSRGLRDPIVRLAPLALGVLPSVLVYFVYNGLRFGDPLESGYALAILPPFLEAQRAIGLFSLAHVPMNVDYFLLHLPRLIPSFPFFRPDGLGMSVLVTSPGLLFALRADWRRPVTWALAGAVVAVLVPSLLYYGGGWLQYGYRYFLDSVPIVMALTGLAAVHRGGIGPGWRALIVIGTLVMLAGVYWAYHL